MDTRINTRSLKIHIYSPSLTTVIGFFWAQINSVDEADTKLKLLIQAHNKEVRSQGREGGWGKRTLSSALTKTTGLEIPAEEKIPFNKTWVIQFRLLKSICSPSVSEVPVRGPWDVLWCWLEPPLALGHPSDGRKTSNHCTHGSALLGQIISLVELCCLQLSWRLPAFPGW